jgi:hypothetical protein
MARIWAAEAVKGTYDAVRPKQVLFSTTTCACAVKNGTHLAKLKLSDLRGLGALAPALTWSSCTCLASDALTTVCSAATSLGTVSQLQPASFSLVLQLHTADKCPAMLGHRLQGGLCCPLN